jgi:hypothetical protein
VTDFFEEGKLSSLNLYLQVDETRRGEGLLQLGDIEIGQSAKTPPKTAISHTFYQRITLQLHPVHT